MSEFEPRVNGGTINSGRFCKYNVIVVGILEGQLQFDAFRFKTSDDVSITIKVPNHLQEIFTRQSGKALEVFEIVGEVQEDCSVNVSRIIPLFDSSDDGKDFDLKLYDKLVGYWNNQAFSHMFFPSTSE